MSTQKHRYQVAFNPEIEAALKFLSKKQHKSVARITEELVEKALEMDEDAYLCELVQEIEHESKGKKPIPAEKVWKELGLE